MPELEAAAVWMPTLLLVTVRVAGMVAFAPAFGHSAVPARVRVIVGAAMALAAVGRLARPVALPAGWFDLATGLGGELLIGAAIGYTGRLIFTGIELGAFHVSSQMGLSLAEVINPLAADAPAAVRGLFRLVAVVVFLAVGGHRALIRGLLETFDVLPPLGFAAPGGLLDVATGCLGASFVLALRVAAPVLVAMLLATVALGLLHRTVPQCNLLTTGLPIRVMLGLVVMAASLGAMAPLLETAATQLGRTLRLLTAAAG